MGPRLGAYFALKNLILEEQHYEKLYNKLPFELEMYLKSIGKFNRFMADFLPTSKAAKIRVTKRLLKNRPKDPRLMSLEFYNKP